MKTLSVISVLTIVLLHPVSIFPQLDNASSRASLRGIKKVDLEISTDSGFRAGGGDADRLRTDVELKLRMVGLEVTERDADGLVSVSVQSLLQKSVTGRDRGYCFVVGVAFLQSVVLLRDIDTRTIAYTWSSTVIASCSAQDFPAYVREQIDGDLKTFLNAYLAVNPKRAP